MKFAGTVGRYAIYAHGDRCVFVDTSTFDVTDPLPFSAVTASGAMNEQDAADPGPYASMLAAEVLSGTSLDAGSETFLVPAAVQRDAARGLKWASLYGDEATLGRETRTAQVLANQPSVSVNQIRSLARSFAAEPGLLDVERVTGVPTQEQIALALLGGRGAANWAALVADGINDRALVAAGYDPDANVIEDDETEGAPEFPGDKPHVFVPVPQAPFACAFCFGIPDAEQHDPEAVDYSVVRYQPTDTHLFTVDPKDESVCEICGEKSQSWQHVNAVIALNRIAPFDHAKHAAFYQEDATAPAEGQKAMVASAAPAEERYDVFSDEGIVNGVLDGWQDDKDYYVSVSDSDSLTAEALYMLDGDRWFRWTPLALAWTESAPVSAETLVEVDDETAFHVLDALAKSGGCGCDMREVDPAEALLVELSMPEIDWDAVDRVIVASGEDDGGYTAEERAENAKKQVRDKNGRFAKSNSRVILPNGFEGVVRKADGETQRVEVETADGTMYDVRADEIEVIGNAVNWDDLEKIQAQPRANRTTPKAWLSKTLPILDRRALDQIFADYPAYIERERNWAMDQFAGLDPAKSDVPPVYLAVVDDLDKSAVLELLAVVPASETSTEPVVMQRTAKGWEQSEEFERALRSVTPPPVVKIEGDMIASVTSQVDEFYATEAADPSAPGNEDSVVASLYGPYGEMVAVTADGRIGNAERLRQYWTTGRGGAKIRWNTPGDWTRCYRHLKKYMGPRAKGYCANLHKRATGTWPGDKNNVGKRDRFALVSEQYVVALAASAALQSGEAACSTCADVSDNGSAFVIPMLAPVGVKSGDGRMFAPLALSTRDLPIPLMWQIKTQAGHDSSVLVGRIDSVETLSDGSLGNARGVFDNGSYGREAERLIRNGFLRGVSVDLDQFEASSRPNEAAASDEGFIGNDETTITRARVMGATLVPKPAFQECYIEIFDDGEEPIVADGVYAELSGSDMESLVAAATLASSIPVFPPESWFSNPELRQVTPLTVTDEGRVFGHVAAWHVDHIGLPISTKPPRSRSNYAYFHTGLLRTESGKDVNVGQLTLAGGHADLHMSANEAKKHYDDTMSALADVRAGEDQFGIWVSGALRPDATPEQIRAFRASAPSGDWRPINGRLEMVAVCQVNVPGFPVARAMVAGGAVLALVAAGTSTLMVARQKQDNKAFDALVARVDAIDAPQRAKIAALREATIARRAEKARARFSELAAGVERLPAIDEATAADLEAQVASVRSRFDAVMAERGGKEGRKRPEWAEHEHPRGNDGQFRDILARLRTEITDATTVEERKEAVARLDAAEEALDRGEEGAAKEAAAEVLRAVDKFDIERGDSELPSALRDVYAELGDMIYNEAIALGDTDTKLNFTDLPPAVQSMISDLLSQVENLPGLTEEGKESLHKVQNFMGGADAFTQPEISGELSRLVRLLL